MTNNQLTFSICFCRISAHQDVKQGHTEDTNWRHSYTISALPTTELTQFTLLSPAIPLRL